jgi:nucleoside-diphosphate-sugar epimerase
MRLLVLGGTWFLGRHIVEEALRRNHDVVTFNRGISAPDVPGGIPLRGDRSDPNDLSELARHGDWDAVIDLSGYVPNMVLATVEALRERVSHYVFMSTVSVYPDWPWRPVIETSPIHECSPSATRDDAPTSRSKAYGILKAGCERAVTEGFGPRTTILRPGVVLGPRETIGRLPWWLRRMVQGGDVLAPGPAKRRVQPVDVRDVAAFALDLIHGRAFGTFNVAAPVGHSTYGAFLQSCIAATGGTANLVWVGDQFLIDHDVHQWTELPLWRTYPGTWNVDAARARKLGLRSRPLQETVLDTWEWLAAGGRAVDHQRQTEQGIAPDKEQRLLALWRQQARL